MNKFILISALTCIASACNANTPTNNTITQPTIYTAPAAATASYASYLNQAKVVLFTQSGCSFCTQAKNLLSQKNIDHLSVTVGDNPALINELIKAAGGSHRTYPFVFVNGKFLGGYSHLEHEIKNGKIN